MIHLRPSGVLDWNGEPLFHYRDLDAGQREAERLYEAAKVMRYRVAADGTMEGRKFDRPEWAPVADGWATTQTKARKLHAALAPPTSAHILPAIIPLPAPPRYARDKRRCGAKTRKGVPCQAQGLGKGGRCKNHGGMSTGARTPEGRQRCAEALRRRREARNTANQA